VANVILRIQKWRPVVKQTLPVQKWRPVVDQMTLEKKKKDDKDATK
jgi:hypothetical protein